MVIDQELTEKYAIYNADCVDVMKSMADRSVHMSVHSPPFGGLYHYSSSERDMSNCKSYEEFLGHYGFAVKELARITMPGRIAAVHCMDVPKLGANICGYTDFPGDLIKLYAEHGFEYIPRICIWKEPLGVRNRTMSKALYHCQIVDDSTKTNCAASDYLIPFRRNGENQTPVTHEHGLLEYYGERKIPEHLLHLRGFTGNQIKNSYSHWIWRQYASSIWDDIRLQNVLPFKESRDEDDEKHVHPLQLDVINRSCELWSNPGEIVFTPFMGVGSEVYGAVLNGRKGVGVELKPSYFKQAKKNLESLYLPSEEQKELF